MDVRALGVAGAFEVLPRVLHDRRGRFVKTFHRGVFESLGFATEFREQYYSISRHHVLRGLHFQVPPDDHVKVVACLQGHIFDVGVDIRIGSPTFGRHFAIELSASKGNMVYLPKGVAHGFLTLSEEAIVTYNVTSVYSPESDRGVHWASACIPWPTDSPIVSDRDQHFVTLDNFISPFKWVESKAA